MNVSGRTVERCRSPRDSRAYAGRMALEGIQWIDQGDTALLLHGQQQLAIVRPAQDRPGVEVLLYVRMLWQGPVVRHAASVEDAKLRTEAWLREFFRRGRERSEGATRR